MSEYSKIKLEDVPTLFGLNPLDHEWSEYSFDSIYILLIYLSIQFFHNKALHKSSIEKLLSGKGFVYKESTPFCLTVYRKSIICAAIDEEIESVDMYEIVSK